MATDWRAIDRDILTRIDIAAEAEALGVRFSGDQPGPSGWRACYAIDRDESNPSAAVNVASQNGKLGQYKDSASGSKAISFFELATVAKKFTDFRAARQHYADRAGVAIPVAGGNGSDGNKTDGPALCQLRRRRGDCDRLFATRYANAKAGVTVDAIAAAGGEANSWPLKARVADQIDVLAFRAFRPDDPAKPTAVMLVRTDGQPFAAVGKGLPERKTHLLRGSRCGIVVLGGQEALGGAETVWLCEGLPDALTLFPHLPTGHAAATCSHGADTFDKALAGTFGGKKLWIVYDADHAGEAGAAKVAAACFGVAAEIKLVRLPHGVTERHGKDVRDFFVEGHTFDELAALAEAADAITEAPAGADDDEGEELGLTERISDRIIEQYRFAQDEGGKLFCYEVGVYRANGEAVVRRSTKELMRLFGEEWSTKIQHEVTEYIRVDRPQLDEQPPLDSLNLLNGILDVETRELRPHDPERLSTIQLPVAYDPDATCEQTEAIVNHIFPEDAVELAWQIVAWLMLPDVSIQKAVLLTGDGSNGKSTWLAQVMAFLGRRNVSGASLQQLESRRFATTQLYGKLANICPDLPSEDLAGTSVFKAIVGNDDLTAEHKFGRIFMFRPFCRLVFSANHLPRSGDDSTAFFRRWLVIPFTRTLAGDDVIPRPVLDRMLHSPGELSGLLNKALDALPGLRRDGFSESASTRDAASEFQAITDPFTAWFDKAVETNLMVSTPVKHFLDAYNETLVAKRKAPITGQSFGIKMKRAKPDLERKQATYGGAVQWCYVGIQLRNL